MMGEAPKHGAIYSLKRYNALNASTVGATAFQMKCARVLQRKKTGQLPCFIIRYPLIPNSIQVYSISNAIITPVRGCVLNAQGNMPACKSLITKSILQ